MDKDIVESRKRLQATARAIAEKTRKEKEGEFRVVVAGKGGAGKTTITALLARLFSRDGYRVLAVDEDPQMILPFALGAPETEAEKVIPLNKNLDYIEEKVGVRPGEGWGLMFRLNPDVTDVVERFGIKGPDNVNILVMGTVIQAAAGCLCPENALLESVVRYVNLRDGEIIIMDTQAGVEHFGRALAKGFKQALLVSDPTFNSVQVAKKAGELAKQLGIPWLHLLINRVKDKKDRERVKQLFGDSLKLFEEVFYLPYEESILGFEPNVGPMLDLLPPPPFMEILRQVKETLILYGEKD